MSSETDILVTLYFIVHALVVYLPKKVVAMYVSTWVKVRAITQL